jgi:hypothetical protein
LLYRDANGESWLTRVGSPAEPRRAPGLTPADRPVGFSKDNRSVFVQVDLSIPMRVDRVDLSTGARSSVADVAPPDRAGIVRMQIDQWKDDGRAYTYRMSRTLSTLFVVN